VISSSVRRYGLAAAVALLAGFGAARWFTAVPVAAEFPALLDLPVVDLDGRAATLSRWQGRFTLVNFWATWCAPCREEIPLLMAVQGEWRARGLRVIGVAIDDADAVRRYRDALDIRYPILLADADALRWMAAHGNPTGGLPFSVLLDHDGQLMHRKLGAYRGAELGAELDRAISLKRD